MNGVERVAPRARWRERVVAYGRVLPEPTAAAAPRATGLDDAGVKPIPRARTWAALMHGAFAIGAEARPRPSRLRRRRVLIGSAQGRGERRHVGAAKWHSC
jgi:hypothetical protein